MNDQPEQQTPPETGANEPARKGWFSVRKRIGSGDAVSAQNAAPPPPPRRRKRRRPGLVALFSGLLTAAMVGALVLAGVYAYGARQFSAPGPLATDKTVIIARGASSEDIVNQLSSEGVIANSGWFGAALTFRDIQARFAFTDAGKKRAKAGEYLFKANTSMAEVLDIITSGRSVEHSITIPEGLTSEQIVQRLRDNPLLTGDIADTPPEGALQPDTYKITRGGARSAVLERMQAAQRRLVQEVWSRRAKDLPLRSPHELITLASIVEKETGRGDERHRVAGVFYNRLAKGMKLQSDPTIIYGLVGGKATLGRGLTRSEIDKPTAYNTYVIQGLPPGPIANPGKAALEATANPSRTKELFFVADGTGGHVFSETLDQHNRNVTRWRQIEANRAAAASNPQTPANVAPASPPAANTAPAVPPTTTPPAETPQSPQPQRPGIPQPRSGLDLDRSTYDLSSPKTVPKL